MSKRLRNSLIALAIILVVALTPLVWYLVFANDVRLDWEEFLIQGEAEFSIVHLSDMHFPDYRVNLDELVAGIAYRKPDIIAITGDFVSGRTLADEIKATEPFLQSITAIAPVFFVDGNHEASNPNTPLLHQILQDSGVILLKNDYYVMNFGGNDVLIVGRGYGYGGAYTSIVLDTAQADFCFVLLLSHEPSFDVSIYIGARGAGNKIAPNLILSGHIHGGHFRFFGHAIFCPDTFLFPRFSNGLYVYNDISMILSRGTGNYLPIRRVGNLPHVPVILVG